MQTCVVVNTVHDGMQIAAHSKVKRCNNPVSWPHSSSNVYKRAAAAAGRKSFPDGIEYPASRRVESKRDVRDNEQNVNVTRGDHSLARIDSGHLLIAGMRNRVHMDPEPNETVKQQRISTLNSHKPTLVHSFKMLPSKMPEYIAWKLV